MLSLSGESATFSGEHALGKYATAEGNNCIALGNLLEDTVLPQAMIDSFESSTGNLTERLLLALEAGLAAGGEAGPVRSAGILVAAADTQWPVVDLRVDWHVEPIHELRMVWQNYEPQMDAYVTRYKNPAGSESFGVPGDE